MATKNKGTENQLNEHAKALSEKVSSGSIGESEAVQALCAEAKELGWNRSEWFRFDEEMQKRSSASSYFWIIRRLRNLPHLWEN